MSDFYSVESEGGDRYVITATDPNTKQVLFGWGSDGRGYMWRYGQPSHSKKTTRGHRSSSHDYRPWEWHLSEDDAATLLTNIKSNPSPASEKTAAPEKELCRLLGKIWSGTVSSKTGSSNADQDDTIIEGLAKLAWAMRWADEEEAKEDGENFSGVDIYDAAPEPPKEAFKWAKEVAAQITKSNGATLTELFERAQEAGFPGDAESFGADLSHEANGTGIDWTDRVMGGGGRDLRHAIKVPRKEFYY